jgi:hypothetical protein
MQGLDRTRVEEIASKLREDEVTMEKKQLTSKRHLPSMTCSTKHSAHSCTCMSIALNPASFAMRSGTSGACAGKLRHNVQITSKGNHLELALVDCGDPRSYLRFGQG